MALSAANSDMRELAPGVIEGLVVDDDQAVLGSGTVEAMLLTAYVLDDNLTILNNRLLQNVLNQNQVTLDASGNLTFYVQPADNIIVNSALARDDREGHVAHFVWCWESTSSGTLSNAIATTDGSTTVTVTHASHGYSVGQTVFFVDADEVGGLNINGVRIVATVPTSNTYTFEHPNAATADEASGGGTGIDYFTWASIAKIGRKEIGWNVVQMNKAPGG